MSEQRMTAAKAGISGKEQILLALELMAKQRGKATMQEIYAAIEAVMPVKLSKQGESSLRTLINREAVTSGFIKDHRPGDTVWELTDLGFLQSMLKQAGETELGMALFDFPKEIETIPDGRRKLISHWIAERRPDLIEKVKDVHRKKGTLACEVCDFSFLENYDEDYIELHHTIPLSQLAEPGSAVNSLALVCANCHRMLHRGAKWPSIAELKAKVQKRKHSHATLATRKS